MIHINKTFPACSVVAVVVVCSHGFQRHLDLCDMFDRPLCRKIVAVHVLRRKGKIAAIFRCNVVTFAQETVRRVYG